MSRSGAGPKEWLVPLNRRELLRAAGLVGTAAVVPGALAACGSGDEKASSGVTPGGATAAAGPASLDLICPGLPPRLDSAEAGGDLAAYYLIATEPALLFQPDGSTTPNLATVEQVDDKSATVTVRDGVTFWDGSPLTAEDVAYSFKLHLAAESKLNRLWQGTRSFAVSGQQVIIEMAYPLANLGYALALTPIVSKAYHQKNKAKIGSPKVLNMGTGPWKFEEFVPNDHLTFVANDSYWGDKPSLQRITVKQVADQSTAVLAFRSGDVSGQLLVPPSDVKQYEALNGYRVQSGQNPELLLVWFDTRKKPFDDIHVRRAVQHAIDREAVIQGALRGHGEVATTFVRPETLETILNADEVDAVYEYIADATAYDLERARAELKQSTVPDGFTVEMEVRDTQPAIRKMAEIIGASLSQIGITLKIKQLPFATAIENVFAKTRPMPAIQATPETPDPAFFPLVFFHSKYRLPAFTNLVERSDPAVDKLVERLERSGDGEQRGRLVADIMRYNADQALYQCVCFPNAVVALKDSYEYRDWNGYWYNTRWPNQIVAS